MSFPCLFVRNLKTQGKVIKSWCLFGQKPENTRKSHRKLMSFRHLFGLKFEDEVAIWLNSSNSNQTKIGCLQPPFIVAPTAHSVLPNALTSSLRVFFFFGKAVSRETNVQETDTMNGWIKFFKKKLVKTWGYGFRI